MWRPGPQATWAVRQMGSPWCPQISQTRRLTRISSPRTAFLQSRGSADVVPTPGGLAYLLGCVPRLRPRQPVALAFRGRVGVGRGVYKLESAHPRFLVASGLTGTRAQTASWSRGQCVLLK